MILRSVETGPVSARVGVAPTRTGIEDPPEQRRVPNVSPLGSGGLDPRSVTTGVCLEAGRLPEGGGDPTRRQTSLVLSCQLDNTKVHRLHCLGGPGPASPPPPDAYGTPRAYMVWVALEPKRRATGNPS